MTDPLQVRVGGPLRVPHAGEGPEGVPEAPEAQTVSGHQRLEPTSVCASLSLSVCLSATRLTSATVLFLPPPLPAAPWMTVRQTRR